MSLFAQFATNQKAEAEGIPVTFGGTNEDGTVPTFMLARMGRANKRYLKMLEVETKANAVALRTSTLDSEADERITRRIFCRTVLVGWKNIIVPEVFEQDGPVHYSHENAEKLMVALPELYSELTRRAQDFTTFRTEEIERDSKS